MPTVGPHPLVRRISRRSPAGDTYKRLGTLAAAMYALSLEAPDPDALRARLAPGFADRGPVAVVERVPAVDPPGDGVATTVRLDGDGRYAAAGTVDDLDAALEALAPEHEVALVVGAPDADLPRVVVGDAAGEDVLAAAGTVEAIDPDAVVAALDEVEPVVTLASLVARAKTAPGADRAGAIATFTGRVRARDAPDDVETTALEFEKYAGVADERLAALAEELSARDGVHEVLLHHRTGVVEAGEDIVFVVVLAGHREEAFRTVSAGIDRLKAEVPLFKKEITVEESFWVHERP